MVKEPPDLRPRLVNRHNNSYLGSRAHHGETVLGQEAIDRYDGQATRSARQRRRRRTPKFTVEKSGTTAPRAKRWGRRVGLLQIRLSASR